MAVGRRIVRSRGVRREGEVRGKIELSLVVKDFGPISRGEIAIKPLTIFIGPNNSGKSYAAMLVHSIFYPAITLPEHVPFFYRWHFLTRNLDIRKIPVEETSELKRQVNILKEGDELEIPKTFLEKVTDKIFDELYVKRLGEEIIRSYASPLSELIRIGKKSFALKINFNSHGVRLTYQREKLKIEEKPKLDLKIKVQVTDKLGRSIGVNREKEKEYSIQIGEGIEKEESDFRFSRLMNSIFEICASILFENLAVPCYYLPAARSGILQGHKALAASIVKKSPYVGIERLEIPKFSGVVSDFISSVITLPEEKGAFYPLAQEFEKKLIKGEIVVRTLDEYVYPEIKYSFLNTEIPLHRASSTVSELAPLFLYLKYVVEPGSVLIIEEPEAHLHPKNQRILARFLVKLIRNGVYIIITTHSEYLLEQLSSFIMLSKIEPKKRVEKYGYDEEDFLKTDEIAAYLFNYDIKSGGNKITEVKVTEEDGISQDEFSKIIETLYEETIRLRRDLSGDT
ncbi:MAG: AAA family ATPase [Methanophagales archaeon]|nr:AAA family ATPase [Methanophagales archaeon]